MDRRSFLKSLAASAVAAGASPALARAVAEKQPILLQGLRNIDETILTQHSNGWWHVSVHGSGYTGQFGDAYLPFDKEEKLEFRCFVKPVGNSVKVGGMVIDPEDGSESDGHYKVLWPSLQASAEAPTTYVETARTNLILNSEGD